MSADLTRVIYESEFQRLKLIEHYAKSVTLVCFDGTQKFAPDDCVILVRLLDLLNLTKPQTEQVSRDPERGKARE